jgi:hypothetical protein
VAEKLESVKEHKSSYQSNVTILKKSAELMKHHHSYQSSKISLDEQKMIKLLKKKQQKYLTGTGSFDI